jgi:hypothetical protein
MLLSSQPTHTLNALAVAATALAGLAVALGACVLLLVLFRLRSNADFVRRARDAARVRRTLAERVSVKLRSEFKNEPAHAHTGKDHRDR